MDNTNSLVIRSLIDKLHQIEAEITTPPQRSKSVISQIFGVSQHERKRQQREEKKRIELLGQKKISVINSSIPPKDDDGLIEMAHLALSNFKSTANRNEREAWRNKLQQVLIRMQGSINSGTSDSLGDEYLFINNEINDIRAQYESERRNKLAVAISAVALSSSVAISIILASSVALIVGIGVVSVAWIARLFQSMSARRDFF